MPTPRGQIIALIEQGQIPPGKIDDALRVTGITPDARTWKKFIDRLLLCFGSLALAFAAVFFIAYNWDDMGRMVKFGLVEILIIGAMFAYCKYDDPSLQGKVSLLVAAIFLGALLALFGQTYQTGADPWQLFFNWALLMLPWAMVGRFSAIWILWVALMNLAIILYHQAFQGIPWLMLGSDSSMLWLVFIFNTLVSIAWEFMSTRWSWLKERWSIRMLAAGSGTPITWQVVYGIIEQHQGLVISGSAWILWIALMIFIYRRKRPDLFMLACCCLSAIVVTVTLLGRILLDSGEAGGFLILALAVIGLGAGSAVWLRNVHREWHS